jgi:hypothetical protein
MNSYKTTKSTNHCARKCCGIRASALLIAYAVTEIPAKVLENQQEGEILVRFAMKCLK